VSRRVIHSTGEKERSTIEKIEGKHTLPARGKLSPSYLALQPQVTTDLCVAETQFYSSVSFLHSQWFA
jgi:hypothetical protein